MSLSGRDLIVISTAAALGGGLVALAYTAGKLQKQSPYLLQEPSLADKQADSTLLWWHKLLPRSSSSQSTFARDCKVCAVKGFTYVDADSALFLRHFVNKGQASTETHTRLSSSQPQKEEKCIHCNGIPHSDAHSIWQATVAVAEKAQQGESETLKVSAVSFENECSVSTSSPVSSRVGKPDPYSPSKRKGYLSWDDYFMSIAFLSAKRSKDPNRQVGACIVSQDRVILGIGYNGFPRGCPDDELPWAKISVSGDPLQTKYPYVCHAEVNAILNKNHASAAGQRLYVTLFPCNECAKIIIQAGIAEVVYFSDKGALAEKSAGVAGAAYIASRKLLSMAGIKANYVSKLTIEDPIEFSEESYCEMPKENLGWRCGTTSSLLQLSGAERENLEGEASRSLKTLE